MITKHFYFGDYILRIHLYREPFSKIGFVLNGKRDKWNGQRLQGQFIILGFHFSFTFYSPIRNRIKAVNKLEGMGE